MGGRHAPDLFQLRPQQVALLNDDRIGRCLDRLFDGLEADLILTVVRQVIDEFHISLDELHNDSTTVSFHGAYEDAAAGEARAWPTFLGHHPWP